MHAILSLMLASVSVGLSNFAGAIGIGLSGVSLQTRIRVGLAFGFFEAFMPVIGLLLGHSVAGVFGHYGNWSDWSLATTSAGASRSEARRSAAVCSSWSALLSLSES